MEKKLYSTDVVMKKLWLHLVTDFRNAHGIGYSQHAQREFIENGVKGLRLYKFPYRSQVSPYLFKTEYQLENLFKRYRFKDDLFSDSELVDMAYEKFEATQERVATPLRITTVLFRVLQRARGIISDILGEFSENEHIGLCRFGKRACVGHSYSRSYLDLKFATSFSGSHDHIEWFNNTVLPGDKILQEVLSRVEAKGLPRYTVCDTLTLSLVPKSYKALRSIIPDTLIGSYYTYGLGRLLQAKLLSAGLDIRHLQKRHGIEAKRSSITRYLATADLSAASDSISVELLRRLLPSKWFRAILRGRINRVQVGDKVVTMSSVITMGLGHTFPLQTLIFYALLKAIGELVTGRSVYISVYGDDLLYPSYLHRYVRCIFPKLHLILNGDKTYVTDQFRESCGSDYYRGSDVRPFQPEGEFQLLSRQPYAAYLYKLLNGLCRRWDPVEIPNTIDFLKGELILSNKEIFQVPPSFPDGAGFKVDRPYDDYFYAPVNYDAKSKQMWVFNYLHVCADHRIVKNQLPYFWEALRQQSLDVSEQHPWDKEVDNPILHWPRKTRIVRGRLVKTKHPGLKPFVSSKTKSTVLRQTGSTSSWT